MNTNDLKKGDRIRLRNGWFATIVDNKKGNIRLADVEGYYREIGSVYSHDIVKAEVETGPHQSEWKLISHTPKQMALREIVGDL